MGDCGPSDSEVVQESATTTARCDMNGSVADVEDCVDPRPTDSATKEVFNQDADNDYPLAIKMMFNYEAESYATAILNAMHR